MKIKESNDNKKEVSKDVLSVSSLEMGCEDGELGLHDYVCLKCNCEEIKKFHKYLMQYTYPDDYKEYKEDDPTCCEEIRFYVYFKANSDELVSICSCCYDIGGDEDIIDDVALTQKEIEIIKEFAYDELCAIRSSGANIV